MIEIRQLSPDDWPLLREVRLAALRDSPYAFASTLEYEAAFDEWQWRERVGRASWFVLVSRSRAVGLVGGFVEDTDELHMIGMWVATELRGTGLAGRLVESFLAWARAGTAPGVLLWVTDGNDRARRFYQRFGFQPTGVRQPLPSDPSVGEEQLRLALVPTPPADAGGSTMGR